MPQDFTYLNAHDVIHFVLALYLLYLYVNQKIFYISSQKITRKC